MKMALFRDVAPFRKADINRSFRDAYRLYHHTDDGHSKLL
jgi:hypothetical protein